MKVAWLVLLISAFTDFVITAGSGLTAAMVAKGEPAMPSEAVWLITAVAGIVSAARTIQQALKATPETIQSLKGN
jgi:hypothetical protein